MSDGILYERRGRIILFGAKKKLRTDRDLKKAIAFVDYEHWYISLNNLYGMKTDIRAWQTMLSEKYDVVSIYFFGNFSNPALRSEISRIREVSNLIIETQNSTPHYKKDFTDFIMLDHIYQTAIDSDGIDAFVIFTGDGHFSSVVSFLTSKCRKEVGIYAVRDALSTQLKNCATYCVTVPSNEDITVNVQKAIVRAIEKIYAEKQKPRPTFVATVDAVAAENSLDKDAVTVAMNSLIESGCVFQKRIYVAHNKTVKILAVDHGKAEELGLV